MKKFVLYILFAFLPLSNQAQDWSFSIKKISSDEIELLFKADIEGKWHIYSQYIDSAEFTPIPTSFHFEKSNNYELLGEFKSEGNNYVTGFINEGLAEKVFDDVFGMDLMFFGHEASFSQKIKILSDKPFKLKGYLEFMCCDDKQCLPPEEVEYEFSIEPSADKKKNNIEKYRILKDGSIIKI